jgi:hypothetical protein
MQKIEKNEQRIDRFIDLVFKGVEAWMEAGKIVCEILDEDPEALDRIVAQCPNISPEMVIRFEQIGRKQIHPQLLLSDAPGVRHLRRQPFQLQEKHAKEPVEMLVKTDKGWETLQVDVRNLTARQAEQVFGKEGIRSAAAQRVYLEDQNARHHAPPVKANLPYRVVGREIVVMEPCRLSAREVAQILADIEKSK